MSHPAQLEFVETARSLFPEMFKGRKVLEVGSLDVNGSVRGFFEECAYTGIDIAPGKGVDVVCEGQDFDAPDDSFDVVISCEVMEHNPHWAATFKNMIRLARPGGLLVMSCASAGRKEHGTARTEPEYSPLTVEQGWNYYRNLTARDIASGVDLSPLKGWAFATNWDSCDLYFLGVKSGASSDPDPVLARFRRIYRRRFWTSWRWIRRAARKGFAHRFLGIR